jgi:hypothetical protein
MADEDDFISDADEPSPEDFEADEHVEPPGGARAVVFRVLRVAGVLILILALLLYFVVPFRVVALRVLDQLRTPLQSVPLAPHPKSNPSLPV